jgi:WD40 repeat protein
VLVQDNLKQSAQITNATSLRDVQWATQTCILGWPVQGIFDPSQDGTDINMVDRSPSGSVVATADDYGNVNLFRYPCVEQTNEKRTFSAHSSHVSNVRWTADEKFLFSAGGNDKTFMQWRVI